MVGTVEDQSRPVVLGVHEIADHRAGIVHVDNDCLVTIEGGRIDLGVNSTDLCKALVQSPDIVRSPEDTDDLAGIVDGERKRSGRYRVGVVDRVVDAILVSKSVIAAAV